MIAAFDVDYAEDGSAHAAAVVFEEYADADSVACYTKRISQTEEYHPGEFYRRELPCILALIDEMEVSFYTIIVDGYVKLGDKPGLGAHLQNAVGPAYKVIGVAKSYFAGSHPGEVLRGISKNPLYVTTSGIDLKDACNAIALMHGPHRIPTLLKQVDQLCRKW
ncbi:endonuclease V [Cerasicoccus maritimus]|uniref:endonuclease V n=1 Tax=Cerasicoccus maritimus TaxID=490089 RepID=UPI002852CBFB|nr:endonuclease V [Cerasicoccus maritimus]